MSEKIRIMVVDDEPDVEALVRQKFRREIRKGQMDFIFAQDGQEALDLLEHNQDVLLVLSDINMPKMDGLTLLTHLEEKFSNLKTIVVSAYGDMENIRTAMNRGAFDFITKPIEFNDLELTIDKTITHIEQFRELQRQKAEAELARATLAKYFSPNVVNIISDPSNQIATSGERRVATFLFTDLAGFTGLVETSPSDLVVELLNRYIEGVARIVFKHEGTVMKIIGDAVQAAFGAPLEQEDHAERAVKCALEIDQFSEAFREEWRRKDVELGATRIGINSGEAIIGNFGGDSFFDYTAYGDSVNIAARLEGANKVLGTRICASANVIKRVPDFQGRPSGMLQLPGRSQTIECFEPQTAEIAQSEGMVAYREAYELLAKGDDSARKAFAALVGTLPEDPLALMHLQRALAGATDVKVTTTKTS